VTYPDISASGLRESASIRYGQSGIQHSDARPSPLPREWLQSGVAACGQRDTGQLVRRGYCFFAALTRCERSISAGSSERSACSAVSTELQTVWGYPHKLWPSPRRNAIST